MQVIFLFYAVGQKNKPRRNIQHAGLSSTWACRIKMYKTRHESSHTWFWIWRVFCTNIPKNRKTAAFHELQKKNKKQGTIIFIFFLFRGIWQVELCVKGRWRGTSMVAERGRREYHAEVRSLFQINSETQSLKSVSYQEGVPHYTAKKC